MKEIDFKWVKDVLDFDCYTETLYCNDVMLARITVYREDSFTGSDQESDIHIPVLGIDWLKDGGSSEKDKKLVEFTIINFLNQFSEWSALND